MVVTHKRSLVVLLYFDGKSASCYSKCYFSSAIKSWGVRTKVSVTARLKLNVIFQCYWQCECLFWRLRWLFSIFFIIYFSFLFLLSTFYLCVEPRPIMNVLDCHKQRKWRKDKSQWTIIVGNYCWQNMQKDEVFMLLLYIWNMVNTQITENIKRM